ncbi:hypothetical protein M9458_014597, partial [Cirrhinus mrigala]
GPSPGAAEDPSAQKLPGVHGGGRCDGQFPRAPSPVQSPIISCVCLIHQFAGAAFQTSFYH